MNAPRRTCALCSTLTTARYCDAHKRKVYADRDQARELPRARGYDKYHRRIRVLCFERDGWRCVDCGWEPKIVSDYREVDLPAPTPRVLDFLRESFNAGARHLHADHQIPIEVRPDLRLVLENLRTRCNVCHNRKTLAELAGRVGRVRT